MPVASILPAVVLVNDAVAVIQALLPLIQQSVEGKQVTDEDIRNAVAENDAAMKRLDELIEQRGG